MATLARPIFLLTDFGTRDHYVGQVKAVIAGIARHCPIHDLTHEVEPFAVDEAAWLLETSMGLLPEDAVVMAVVDPGVGTKRRALVVQAGGRTFVGPDNGILSGLLNPSRPGPVSAGSRGGGDAPPAPTSPRRPVADARDSPSPPAPLPEGEGSAFVARATAVVGITGIEVRELCEPSLMRGRVSDTFHARDVFGPAAAHIAGGADYRRAGPPVGEMLVFPEFCGRPAGMGMLGGHVIHVDRYGNLVTTVRAAQLFPRFEMELGGRVVGERVRTFADAERGRVFCHVDSSGFVAVAMNQGSAAEELGVGRGAPVRVRAR